MIPSGPVRLACFFLAVFIFFGTVPLGVSAEFDYSSSSPGEASNNITTTVLGTLTDKEVEQLLTTEENGTVDIQQLRQALTASKDGIIHIKTKELVALPADVLAEFIKHSETAAINVDADLGTYELPLSVLDLATLSKTLESPLASIMIELSIKKAPAETEDQIQLAAEQLGASILAVPIQFELLARSGARTVEVNSFGAKYVARSMTLHKLTDIKRITAVMFNQQTHELQFVPAIFSEQDGLAKATLKRNGNSVYTVIELNRTFSDLDSHWAKADVELLANRLVIEGGTSQLFRPEENMTRAEFAVLAVRALGLQAEVSPAFTDVSSNAWYAKAVGTAAQIGVIEGYEDGSFRPEDFITREQLSVMVIRAVSYTGIVTGLPEETQNEVLSPFTDGSSLTWSRHDVAAAVHAGLLTAIADQKLGTSEHATRAQAAAILKRMLSYSVQA